MSVDSHIRLCAVYRKLPALAIKAMAEYTQHHNYFANGACRDINPINLACLIDKNSK